MPRDDQVPQRLRSDGVRRHRLVTQPRHQNVRPNGKQCADVPGQQRRLRGKGSGFVRGHTFQRHICPTRFSERPFALLVQNFHARDLHAALCFLPRTHTGELRLPLRAAPPEGMVLHGQIRPQIQNFSPPSYFSQTALAYAKFFWKKTENRD